VAGSRGDVRPPRTTAPSFDVAVGTYLNEARALAERTRLTESSTFPSRVVTLAEDNGSMYRVVVGPFADRITAERAASDLVQRGLVNEARVVAVAQTAPRPR
jgi:cell division septation protein DedD